MPVNRAWGAGSWAASSHRPGRVSPVRPLRLGNARPLGAGLLRGGSFGAYGRSGGVAGLEASEGP